MKLKREIALNKLFNFLVICGILCSLGAWAFFSETEYKWGIGFCVVALFLIIIPCFFTPYCYMFDSEGVSLCYVFGRKERYLWKNIRSIEVDYDKGYSNSNILEPIYAWVFELKGNCEGKACFFWEGHIRKSFRTKRLLEKYWDGTITGYLFEDAKKWLKRRKNKKNEEIKVHLTDEVAQMEREVRAKIREFLPLYEAQAKQLGLDFKTKYVYVTESGEQRSRPKNEGYTYTMIIALSKTGETDENKIVEIGAKLVYTRLGRKAFRGVVNKTFEEELRFFLSDTLQEIRTNGIETYYS